MATPFKKLKFNFFPMLSCDLSREAPQLWGKEAKIVNNLVILWNILFFLWRYVIVFYNGQLSKLQLVNGWNLTEKKTCGLFYLKVLEWQSEHATIIIIEKNHIYKEMYSEYLF